MKNITSIAALLFSAMAFAQAKDCTKYKDGTFRLTDPATKKVCIINREGNRQTERMEESDETYDFDIVWVDGCTYTINPTPATIARKKDVQKGGTMTVKILQVKDSSYVQRVTVANNPKFRRVDEVFLIKKIQ